MCEFIYKSIIPLTICIGISFWGARVALVLVLMDVSCFPPYKQAPELNSVFQHAAPTFLRVSLGWQTPLPSLRSHLKVWQLFKAPSFVPGVSLASWGLRSSKLSFLL